MTKIVIIFHIDILYGLTYKYVHIIWAVYFDVKLIFASVNCRMLFQALPNRSELPHFLHGKYTSTYQQKGA